MDFWLHGIWVKEILRAELQLGMEQSKEWIGTVTVTSLSVTSFSAESRPVTERQKQVIFQTAPEDDNSTMTGAWPRDALTTILPLNTTAIHQSLTALLDNGRSPPQHHHQSPVHPIPTTQHTTSISTTMNTNDHTDSSRTANAVSKRRRYLENNRQAAHRDPFRQLKSLPEDPSPQFFWLECMGQRKAVCVSTTFG